MSARLHPDLILMDLQMPSMSGIEAIQQIRAGNAEVPIGVLSVFETHQYVETAVNVGASGYLAKDATPSDFCEAASALPQGKRNLVAIPHGLMAGLEASSSSKVLTPPHRPRAGGAAGALNQRRQRGDRAQPRDQPQNAAQPHQQHLSQARHLRPGAGRADRGPGRKGRSQPLATGNSVLPSARSCDGRHTGERRPSEWGLRGEPSPPAQIPAFRNGWDAGHSQ